MLKPTMLVAAMAALSAFAPAQIVLSYETPPHEGAAHNITLVVLGGAPGTAYDFALHVQSTSAGGRKSWSTEVYRVVTDANGDGCGTPIQVGARTCAIVLTHDTIPYFGSWWFGGGGEA